MFNLSTVPLGLFALPIAAIIALVVITASVKILREYERAVVNRMNALYSEHLNRLHP